MWIRLLKFETIFMSFIQKRYFDNSNVQAFTTSRNGGCSQGSFGGFNISPYSGDVPQNVERNKATLVEALQIKPEHLIFPYQTHEDKILIVDNDFLKMSAAEREKLLFGVDALICAVQNVCIGVNTADCVPILLYDAQNSVSAAIHAGWRGVVKGILPKTIARMVEVFGTKPEYLRAAIGPCISGEVYEVGTDLLAEFENAGFDNSQIFSENPLRVDLVRATEIQLKQAGVLLQNIEMSNICTYSQSDKFFSARKLSIQSGRCFSAIVMR